MRERPILMTGESVRAILAGTKTQTRRVITPQPVDARLSYVTRDGDALFFKGTSVESPSVGEPLRCPYGGVGDRLWVREAWWQRGGGSIDLDGEWHFVKRIGQCKENVAYRADHEVAPAGEYMYDTWRPMPSIFMPRWASRLTLELTAVRVERVQDITEADAQAEGVQQEFRIVVQRTDGGSDYTIPLSYRGGYANLWDSINKKRGYGWDMNPWVFVLSFQRVEG